MSHLLMSVCLDAQLMGISLLYVFKIELVIWLFIFIYIVICSYKTIV